MEHQKPSVLSPAGHDPHMGQVGIEGQIAGEGVGPVHRGAQGPLGPHAVAHGGKGGGVSGGVDGAPGYEAGAVQPERQALPAGAAARGGDHRRDAPARVPPHRVRLAAPEVAHPPHQGGPALHKGPAQGGQLRRKGGGDALPHLALGQRRGDGWDRSTEEQPRQHPGQQQKDGQVGPDGAATPPHAPATPAGPPDCARCPRLNSAPPAPPAPARPWSR